MPLNFPPGIAVLVEYIDYPMVVRGVSTSGLFVLMLILFALLNKLIRSYLSLLNHHPMNYIMGLLLGALRGAVIVIVIFSVVSVLIQCVKGETVFPEAVEESSSYDYLVDHEEFLCIYSFSKEVG